MKKVVISGATSFIGINFIHYLLEKDIDILAIIRKNSKKIDMLPKSDRIKVIECELGDLHSLSINSNDYDVFYHLAWSAPFRGTKDDVYMQDENIKYTLDAVNLAIRLGANTFIGAGTQAEYGNVEGKITPKTPANPTNGYGVAKLCSRKFKQNFS